MRCAFAIALACFALSAQAAVPDETARLVCTVEVSAQAAACADVLSGTRVHLSLDHARYADGRWSAAAVLQNRTPATFGTADGATPDPSGIQLEWLGTPTTTAGTGTVLAPAVLRFETMLAPGAVTAPQAVAFAVPASVQAFSFMVAVRATVYLPTRSQAFTMPASNLAAGATATFAGGIRSARGLSLGRASWSSSDPTVATVNASGVVTAVMPGRTTVTGSLGATSNSSYVHVCPVLTVGGVYTFELPYGAAFCLSGGEGANAEYTVIPTNQSTSSRITLAAITSGTTSVTGLPSPITVPAGSPRLSPSETEAALAVDAPSPGAVPDLPSSLREAERAELARLGPAARIQPGSRQSFGKTSAVTLGIPSGVPAVGDRWLLNVNTGCSGQRIDRVAFVRAVTARAIVVEDSLAPREGAMPYINPSGVTYSADSLGRMFSRVAYGPVTDAFGEPTDLDDNGGRIVLFYTRAVNALTPPGSSSTVLGYVTSRDLYSSDPASCPLSNQGEIAYMLVPDPYGEVNGNPRTVSTVQANTIGTAGHELAHLISNSRRLYFNDTPFQEPWLEEGTAHIAEELMFYSQSVGLTPRQNIALSNLNSGPTASARVSAYNTYANPNFGRLRSYLQNPDTSTVFGQVSPSVNQRGAMWAFLRYAADRYATGQAATMGGDASLYEGAFWAALVKNATSAGLESLRQALELSTTDTVLDWIRDWQIAMYADDAVSGVASTYTNPSWNFRSVYGGLGGFPLATTTLVDLFGTVNTYNRGGGYRWQRVGVPLGGAVTYTLLSGNEAPTGPLRVSVIRTK